ncbi:MAG: hypothetical protein RLZZ603_422, partial [Actinomycetota bacterium]
RHELRDADGRFAANRITEQAKG